MPLSMGDLWDVQKDVLASVVPDAFCELDGYFDHVAADHARVRLERAFVSQETHDFVDTVNGNARNQVY